jgi:hypothetical protein
VAAAPERRAGSASSSGGSSSCTTTTTIDHDVMVNSQLQTAGQDAAATRCADTDQAVAAKPGLASHNSSSRDCSCVHDSNTAPDRDQGTGVPPPAPATERACAWRGASGRELLRCGRCKAAWYCGVDHQRAAWKAGHKQECGAAGMTRSKS